MARPGCGIRPELEVGVTRCSRSVNKTPPSDSRETAGSELSYGYSKGQLSAHAFFLFFFFFILIASPIPSCTSPLALTHTSTPPSSIPSPSSSPSPPLLLFHFHPTLEMIMVQKPVHLLSSPSTHHRRHPSAPPAVLVQPTRIPGLLSLSKPASATPPRSQQQQQHHQNHQNRQSRPIHSKTKPISTARQPPQLPAVTAQPRPSEDLNKLSPSTRPTAKSNTHSTTLLPASEKPPRGRQSSKQSKDKSKPR
jgi:hypothetical protein